jgi:glycosyltransferase involved in cell wall biosynthesis
VEYKLWETYIQSNKNSLEKWYLRIASRRLKKFEVDMVSQLDGVINLSKEDRTIYQMFASNTPLTSIPIAFNQSLLKNYSYEKQFEKQTIVYHLGSMDWRPNIQGVLWFIKEVLPILTKLQPDVQIRLAGKKMPRIFHTYQGANLHVDGEVENALQYQEDKAILIVPLLTGSGIRVKIIEALALGKSIISTTIGAQGIEYSNGENILIADDPRSFAEAIVKCVNSLELQKKLSENSKVLAKTKYSLENVGSQKISFYKQIKNTTQHCVKMH